MVKVNAPMMSLDASGTLGDAITFSKWKGRPYVRERVIPSNPKSGAQVGRRVMFGFLTQEWAAIGAVPKATWDDLADAIVASPFNAYLKEGMEGWHNFLAPSKDTPATRTGTPSDWDLATAAWEENRIKLVGSGAAPGDGWGIAIFASLATPVVTAVGNCILALAEPSPADTPIFWTPPSVATWYFNVRNFTDDGVLDGEGTERSAAP